MSFNWSSYKDRSGLKFLFKVGVIILSFSFFILGLADSTTALDKNNGKDLFINHCSGCHVNGGNIIRRNKTLKLKDLKRNGFDSPEAIAKIAQNGVGIMTGYKELLGDGGDKLVANWVWEASQKAWVQE